MYTCIYQRNDDKPSNAPLVILVLVLYSLHRHSLHKIFSLYNLERILLIILSRFEKVQLHYNN